MLESVRNELIQNEPARDGAVDRNGYVLDFHVQRNAARRGARSVKDIANETPRILGERDACVFPRVVELLMNQRDRLHPRLAFLESFPTPDLLELAHLHVDEARYDLEVVLDPVVNLLEQDLSFLDRC